MSDHPKKTIFELLLPLAPKATAEDEAEARRLGVTIEEYRAIKLETQFEQARQQAGGQEDKPSDIAAEEAEAQRQRREPGLLKPRHTAPNLLVQAAKTPGEVAQMILFVICYGVGMIAIVVIGGERVQKVPGIFQCIGLGLLIIPTMWVSARLWEAMGEGARDACRLFVRFWPLTLVALLFLLGLLKLLLRSAGP